jgi:hypothetical protein
MRFSIGQLGYEYLCHNAVQHLCQNHNFQLLSFSFVPIIT